MTNSQLPNVLENNEQWKQIRASFVDEKRAHFEKKVELLDACRAAKELRHCIPYTSLGRLGLWRFDPYEHGEADDFLCLYFHNNLYTVSSYDNEYKWFFETPETAIRFVIDNLDNQYPSKQA